MKRVGIVGLGNISRKYKKGIEESEVISLVAVCDGNRAALENSVFTGRAMYTDYREMLEREKLDYVIVSTPPATHLEIASCAMRLGVGVIVEKPITVSMNDYSSLKELSNSLGVELMVIFHWQNGIEVENFCKSYQSSRISKIDVVINDPYSEDGVSILPEKRGLMGVWLDSGVNALSMIKLWLSFADVRVVEVTSQKCSVTGLPIYVRAVMNIDGVEVSITVDWRNGVNRKESFLVYDGRTVHLDHSGQRIVDGEDCREYGRMDRLEEHYYNYFRCFSPTVNSKDTEDVHKILFEVAELL